MPTPQPAKATTKTLNQIPDTVSVAEIVYHGEKLTLPENMTIDQGIDLLQRRREYEMEVTKFSEAYDVLPYDGAHAFAEVLIKKFGWAPATATPGFWGPNPPELISVQTSPNEFKTVPWGRFSLPNIEGYVQTGVNKKNGRFSFSLHAQILRKDERTVRSLFAEVREYLKDGSIYQGKAIKIRFCDDDGDALDMPDPQFLDTSKINPQGLIYAADVQAAVETNLFTPVSRVHDCINNGISVKRGVLLTGTYGTGKTMAATVASRLATDVGITYVYVPRADELSDAIEFAKQYQSPACVIFCEDIDRSVNGERTVEMDDILNILDGIDTKTSNIITVLTTNDLDSINPAMLRPGRLDAVINVTPPDAPAVEKLVRLYGAEAVSPDTDLTEVGKTLSGTIPATIAEVVKRAKLVQLRLQAPGEKVTTLSAEALLESAKTMTAQTTLLRERIEAKTDKPTIDSTMRGLINEMITTNANVDGIRKTVEHIDDKI